VQAVRAELRYNTDRSNRGAPAVIYADSLSNRGGTGVYLRRLLQGISSRDAYVLAAVARKLMPPFEALTYSISGGYIRKVLNENIMMPSLAASVSPSLVHLPVFAGRTPRDIPLAVTLHDLAFIRNPSWFPFLKSVYYRLQFKKVAQRADVVIVDSEFTATEARKLLGIEPDRIRRVYLSTDSFMVDPSEFRRRFSIQAKYIVFAGTIEPRKNLAALIDSWTAVNRIRPDMYLVIAGRWGWGLNSLRKKLVNAKGIILTGELTETMLKGCIAGAELLVYPSLYEGFGLPPLEAASAGVTSVLTPAPVLREVYSEISTFAAGYDADSISRAILDSLESRQYPEMLIDFASNFTTERMAEQVLMVYGEFGK